jgi:hypothetical protein
MASLGWESQFVKVSVAGTATVAAWLSAIQDGLKNMGYAILSADDSTIDAQKDNLEVTVIYDKSPATGTYPDGTQYVWVFKIVQCAADDSATAQSTAEAVWAMIGGIGFL